MAIAVMKAKSESVKPDEVKGYKGIKEGGSWTWERKYDGSRHVYIDGHIMSERGICKDNHFPHIRKVLKRDPTGMILDMEIYIEGGTVLDLNKKENWSKAKCCVFDIIQRSSRKDGSGVDNLTARKSYLIDFIGEFIKGYESIVHFPETFETFEEGWKKVEQNNWEGLMMKDVTSIYTFGRSNAWIKIKKKSCCDVEITGHENGSTKGTFIVKMPSGVEARVSGTSVDIVDYYYTNKPKKMEIMYMYLTEDGKPFQPTFVKFIE